MIVVVLSGFLKIVPEVAHNGKDCNHTNGDSGSFWNENRPPMLVVEGWASGYSSWHGRLEVQKELAVERGKLLLKAKTRQKALMNKG